VAQLAARHGVRVVLRSSPFGGVTAVALLPTDLVVAQPGSPALPAGAPADLSNTRELQVVAREQFSWLPSDGAGEVGEHTQVLPASSIGQRPALSVVQNQREVPVPDGPRNGPGPLPRSRPGDRAAARPAGGVQAGDGNGPSAVRSQESQQSQESQPARPVGPRGLPKRVRQQSLAPQLQQDAAAADEVGDVEVPVVSRSPEQLRRMMSSFQAGTARGRHASGDAGDGGSGLGGSDRDGVTG
jgi:hypothetical protein